MSLFVTHLYRAVNDFRICVCLHLDLEIVQRTAEVTFVLPNGVHAVSMTEGTVMRLQLTDGAHTRKQSGVVCGCVCV